MARTEGRGSLIIVSCLVAMAGLIAWLLACTPPSPTPSISTPSPATTPAATLSPTPPLAPALETGRGLFQEKCAQCHGANAEHLVVVNLPSLTERAIANQVRNPTGMMPSFSPQALSDGEMEQIARFLVAVLSTRK